MRKSPIRGSRQRPLSKQGKVLQVLQVLLCCYVWTPNYSPLPPLVSVNSLVALFCRLSNQHVVLWRAAFRLHGHDPHRVPMSLCSPRAVQVHQAHTLFTCRGRNRNKIVLICQLIYLVNTPFLLYNIWIATTGYCRFEIQNNIIQKCWILIVLFFSFYFHFPQPLVRFN